MTDFIVTANKLNFRATPINGEVIAVLPRGHVVSGESFKDDPSWLDVSTPMPQGLEVRQGFVSANFVEAEGQVPTIPKVSATVTPSLAQMRAFAPQGKSAILEAVVDQFSVTAPGFGLTKSKLVMCHFLAQACHESDNFKTTREYWGPTKAQWGYQGRADLENTRPGDGKRFMGRGIFQLTGRVNYRAMGKLLGLDLEGDPDQAADPTLSFKIACQFWQSKGIQKWAEANDILRITKLINGGTNGLAERQAHFAKAMKIF